MFNPPALVYLFLFLSSCSLFILELYCYPSSEYEGSSCKNGPSSGVCKLAPDCPTAQTAIQHRRSHNLERCGFDGFTEIVCCPNTDFRSAQTTVTQTTEEIWTDEPPSKKPPKKVTTPLSRLTAITTEKPQVRGPNLVRKSAQACDKFSREISISVAYHIVEGEDAEPGEFPHMAALGYETDEEGVFKFNCGGTLISSYYVVTAAHCIINIEQRSPVIARLGHTDVPELATKLVPEDYNITNVTVHPQYDWKAKFNDLALLKLGKKVNTSAFIYPACLYFENDDPLGLIITGWGTTSMAGDRSNKLQKAKLTPVPLKECNITFLTKTKRNIVNTQICAADNKSDACQGDSGGPMQIQKEKGSSIYSIVGVTSYGIGCGSRYPGIYTRISRYIDWIENIVWS